MLRHDSSFYRWSDVGEALEGVHRRGEIRLTGRIDWSHSGKLRIEQGDIFIRSYVRFERWLHLNPRLPLKQEQNLSSKDDIPVEILEESVVLDFLRVRGTGTKSSVHMALEKTLDEIASLGRQIGRKSKPTLGHTRLPHLISP